MTKVSIFASKPKRSLQRQFFKTLKSKFLESNYVFFHVSGHTREDGESEEDERSKKVPKPSPSKRKKVKVKSSHHNKMNKKSISSKVKIKTKKEKHNDDGGDER